jgi:cytoskeletal protein RodZ
MAADFGQKLTEAREAQSLSLEKAARETYIRPHYLQALEAGDLGALPSPAQARGFLRSYAAYLGLDVEELLTEASSSVEDPDSSAPTHADVSRPEIEREPKPASGIFSEVGQFLKQQREQLSFSLEDVEQHTHVRVHYLRALEQGRIEDLPSPVQGRGMLSNYASFLGLDPDPLLLRFAEGLQMQLAAKQASESQPEARSEWKLPLWFRRYASGDLIFGGILITGMLVFVIWAAIRITTLRTAAQVENTGLPVGQLRLSTPSQTIPPPTSTPTLAGLDGGELQPTEPSQTEIALPEPPEGGAVQVSVVVGQRAWLRVTVDGQVELEGRVIPGSAYAFSGEERVEILTGNAAALRVVYNQQDLGVLGITGEVVNRIFTVDGIATPTPSPSPTATATPPATPTHTPTPTTQGGLVSTPIP